MQFRAFFSYSRNDETQARWLFSRVDAFRTPAALVGAESAMGPVPRTLHPIFRDREDLAGGGHLTERIQQALAASESLIVLCSPAAAQSPWVNREVELFLTGQPPARVFPVIAGDLPDAADVEGAFFPPALRGLGLLAADLREVQLPNGKIIGDGREGGRLKLIAGLLGVGLDQLTNRERRRQRRLVAGLSVAAFAFAGLAAAAGGLGWLAQERATAESAARIEAERQREAAVSARQLAERTAVEREQQRQLANRNAEEREVQRLAAEANAAEATAQRDQARATLARLFAERAWDAMADEDYLLAARYGLAGWRAAPKNAEEYRAALAVVVHASNDSVLLDGHAAPVVRGFATPVGGLLITSDSAGKTIVRSAQTLKPISTFQAPGEQWLSIGVSPTAKQVITGCSNTLDCEGPDAFSPIVWDTASGRAAATLRGHRGIVFGVAFDPTGSIVATASDDRTGAIWDVATGRMLHHLTGHESQVVTVAMKGDGSLVATGAGYGDHTARVWDVETGALVQTLRGHTHRVDIVKFFEPPPGVRQSDAPMRLFTASTDNTARLWDVATGETLVEFRGHSEHITAMDVSRDGKFLLTASQDKTARVWDVDSGRAVLVIDAHRAPLRTAKFSADGRHVLTASFDGLGRVTDRMTGWDIAVMRGHLGPILDAAFDADEKRVLTVSADGAARLWPAAGRQLLRSSAWASGLAARPAFSPVGDRMAAPRADGSVEIRDARTGARRAVLNGGEGRLDALDFSPSGQHLAAGSNAGLLTIWDLDARSPPAIHHLGERAIPFRLAYSPRNDVMLANASGWFAVDAQRPAQPPTPVRFDLESAGAAGAAVNSVWFSPDGRQVLGLGRGDTVDLFEAKTWRRLGRFQLPEVAGFEAAFSPDGRRFAVTHFGGAATLFDVDQPGGRPRLLRHPPARSGTTANGVAFSPDGRFVATAGGDGIVRLFDAVTGAERAALRGNDVGYGSEIRFSPDSTRLFASGRGGVAVWHVASGRNMVRLPIGQLAMNAAADRIAWIMPDPLTSSGAEQVHEALKDRAGTLELWDVGHLSWPIERLVRHLCGVQLPAKARRFSDNEIAADPLIREVWLATGDRGRDVCKGL